MKGKVGESIPCRSGGERQRHASLHKIFDTSLTFRVEAPHEHAQRTLSPPAGRGSHTLARGAPFGGGFLKSPPLHLSIQPIYISLSLFFFKDPPFIVAVY